MMDEFIGIRRYLHANPELSFEEENTAKYISNLLNEWGINHTTNIGGHGIVGVLQGKNPEKKIIALRADMDALPVTEMVDLPFASKARTEYNGQDVGVMHACGHDNHMAVLMGVAEVLAGMRDRLPGTGKFTFQPAEEGAPAGEDGGAAPLIEEGELEAPRP